MQISHHSVKCMKCSENEIIPYTGNIYEVLLLTHHYICHQSQDNTCNHSLTELLAHLLRIRFQQWLLFLFLLSHLPVTILETITKVINMQKQFCIFIEFLLCDGLFFVLWEWLGGPWSPVSWNKNIQNIRMFWLWFKQAFLLSPDWAILNTPKASEQLQRNCFLLFP